MFKFIHAADLHLDSPLHKLDLYEGAPVEAFRQATRRAFDNLVRLAISENVSFVLIAGDLYDGDWKDYNTGLYLVSRLVRLRDAGIPVFIVAGNHDAASRITRTLRLPDSVTLAPSDKPATYFLEDIDVAVHAQSFGTPSVKKDLSRNYPMGVDGLFNIGLLHTCATGREGHEPYAPCTLDGLVGKGYDYWALGHVHRYEVLLNDPPVVFPGNTQGRHARETGPKGCVLVTVSDGGRAEMVSTPVDAVRWEAVTVDVKAPDTGYDIVDRFGRLLETLQEKNPGLPLAVRALMEGETLALDDVMADTERWTNELRAEALERGEGRIWVEKTGFRLFSPVSDRGLEDAGGAVGELLDLFSELDDDAAAMRQLAAELAEIEKKLPKELKVKDPVDVPDGLRLDDPAWMENLLRQAKPMLLRRLLKKEGPE
jgi:DNA repair exonuclease SbcCD nuclease subunit